MNLKRQFLSIIVLTFLSSFVACHLPQQQHSSSAAGSSNSHYPAHWWTPVSKEGAPDWEILPQEAGPGEVILSKRHELGLLSSFYGRFNVFWNPIRSRLLEYQEIHFLAIFRIVKSWSALSESNAISH